jgi:hypothetical protein
LQQHFSKLQLVEDCRYAGAGAARFNGTAVSITIDHCCRVGAAMAGGQAVNVDYQQELLDDDDGVLGTWLLEEADGSGRHGFWLHCCRRLLSKTVVGDSAVKQNLPLAACKVFTANDSSWTCVHVLSWWIILLWHSDKRSSNKVLQQNALFG